MSPSVSMPVEGVAPVEGVVLVVGTVFDGIFELGTVILPGWAMFLSVSMPPEFVPSGFIPSEFMLSSSTPLEFMSSFSDSAPIPGVIISGLLVPPVVIPGVSSAVLDGGTTCPVPLLEPGLVWLPSTPVSIWPLV